jgi:outer membrane protein assembly factor BamB
MMLRLALILCCWCLGPGFAGAQGTFNVIYENPFLINGGGVAEAIAFHEGEFHVLGRIVGADTLTHGIYLKYSSEGEVLLSELFSSSNLGFKTNVAQLGEMARVEDGIVSPITEWLNYQQGNLNGDSLVKLNYSGEVLWKKSLAVDSTGYEVEIYRGCSDYLGQGYIVHGYIVDSIGVVTSYDQIKGLLTRTDLEGNILWHQRYPEVKEIWYSEALPDGGILLSGSQNLLTQNGSDIVIIRTDAQGKELWRHVFWEDEDPFNSNSETTAPICILQDGTITVITHNIGLEEFDFGKGPWWVKRI